MADSSSPFDPRAEQLFLEFLRRRDAGENPVIEELCRAEPQHATQLRQLLSAYEAASRLRQRAVEPTLAERLKRQFGEGVDPIVSLGGEPKPDSGPQSKLFERLRAEGSRGTRYKLLGEVARGGMGAILRVWDDELRRTLAMKVVLGRGEVTTGDTPAVDPKTLGRFLEEAQITGQLDHPGIVPVHELGLDASGRVYFTMKLVKGDDLRTVFEHVKSGHDGWNQVRALGVLLRVCEAMAFAHSKQVVHRDLKPANVMVGKFGEVYVMDWGLARVLGQEDRHDVRIKLADMTTPSVVKTERHDDREDMPDSPLVTMDGDVVGTPSFMPPEQARGELDKLGPHSDVYSIGAMLYQLVTGEMPYVPAGTRVSPHTILLAVLREPPLPIERLAPATPPELVAICEKAMERDIGKRYPTTLALAADLRAYLEGRVVAAYEAGRWAETKKWVQRNKPLAASLAAGVVALVGGVAFSLSFAREANAERTKTADANATLEQRNAEIERTNAELRAASRDDKLRGMIQEVARLRAQSRMTQGLDRLGRPAYLWWIEESEMLVNGQAEDLARGIEWRPGLNDVQAELAGLRALPSLLPYTEEDAKRDFETHPDAPYLREIDKACADAVADLTKRTRELERLIRARQIRLGLLTLASPASVADANHAELASSDIADLISGAWRYVDPEEPSDDPERLVLAMILAQRAVEVAGETRSRVDALDTLAWAYLWLGKTEEALIAAEQALDRARGDTYQVASHDQITKEANTPRTALESELSVWESELMSLNNRISATVAAVPGHEYRTQLRDACSSRRTWRFSDPVLEWWHALLVALESDLQWQAQMLEVAREAAFSEKARARWSEAIEGIAQGQKYVGQEWPSGERITPQLGLLPLGENPVTGLWEFVHLQTGTEPALGSDGRVLRDAKGRLTLTPETGIVFVLLPGGRVPKSTANDDQEEWITQVELEPYFLSKYEMTQEQWNRLSLRRVYLAGSQSLVPASQISWDDIMLMLQRELGWSGLPSEAQWEYGCRAGSTSKWWPGNEETDLQGVASFDELRPVGGLLANAFGLHDVHGNLQEWCADAWYASSTPRSRDGLRDAAPDRSARRVARGGGWHFGPVYALSSARVGSSPGMPSFDFGLRPFRCVTP